MGVDKIHSGRRYKLTNAKFFPDRVLTFSISENRLIPQAYHGGDNQKWEFQMINDEWTIRNVSNGLYIAPEGPRNSNNDYPNLTKVVASYAPYKWQSILEEGLVTGIEIQTRFLVPGTDKGLEFPDSDSDTVDRWPMVCTPRGRGTHQRWSLDEIKKVIVIAGIGGDSGVGAAIAHKFSQQGYAIALVAPRSNSLSQLQRELDSMRGVESDTFPLAAYSAEAIMESWESIKERFPISSYEIRVGVWNSPPPVSTTRRFLDITPEDIRQSTEININSVFAFARQAILTLNVHTSIETQTRNRGTVIFTGGHGDGISSAFSLFKPALRSLCQSLNKEFGKDGIHVAHVILENFTSTDHIIGDAEKEDTKRRAESIGKSYLHLVDQDKSAWTCELDLRPYQSSRSRALGMEVLDLLARMDDIQESAVVG